MFSLSPANGVKSFEDDNERDKSIKFMVGPIFAIPSYESRKFVLFFHHKNTQLTFYKSEKNEKINQPKHEVTLELLDFIGAKHDFTL